MGQALLPRRLTRPPSEGLPDAYKPHRLAAAASLSLFICQPRCACQRRCASAVLTPYRALRFRFIWGRLPRFRFSSVSRAALPQCSPHIGRCASASSVPSALLPLRPSPALSFRRAWLRISWPSAQLSIAHLSPRAARTTSPRTAPFRGRRLRRLQSPRRGRLSWPTSADQCRTAA